MSNRFSCVFTRGGDATRNYTYSDYFMGSRELQIKAYYFFYCAQPNATSASIQGVRTNLREYYVKRLKIDCCMTNMRGGNNYMMVFVLKVPEDYTIQTYPSPFKFSYLPGHTMPENVLYYSIVKFIPTDNIGVGDIRIDIKKPFKVSPSYKLAFICYQFSNDSVGTVIYNEGTAEVFFEVN